MTMKAASDWNPRYTIDFLAAFDPEGAAWAIEKCGSLDAYGERVVEKMNKVMQNSNINGKFRYIGNYTIKATIPDIPGWSNYVLNDRGLTDYVEEKEADICIVFARCKNTTRPESGSSNFRAGHGFQYACVLVNSGIETNTAIHEAGHVMGCHHAYEMDGGPDMSDTCTYNYAAERTTASGHIQSTVMGYHGELIPYFSSPDLYYNDVQMGSDHEDNCRVINTRMPIIAKLGDKRTQYWLNFTEKEIDYNGQNIDIEIEALKAWRCKSDADWLQTSVPYGYTENLTVSAKANTTGKTRVGHVTISDFDADNPEYTGKILGSTTVTITQYPEGYEPPVPGKDVKITGIALSPKPAEVAMGRTLTLVADITPANATNKVLKWMSDDEKIARVSDNGVVTPVKEGSTVIWAMTTDGTNLGDACDVTVVKAGTNPDPDPKPDPKPDTDGVLYTIKQTEGDWYFTTKEVADHDFTTFSLSANPETFIITPSDKDKSAYTITSTNGTKVGHSVLNTWDFSDNESLWYIDNLEGTPTTITKDGQAGFGIDKLGEGLGVYTDKPDCYWIIKAVKTDGIATITIREPQQESSGCETDCKQLATDLSGRIFRGEPKSGVYILNGKKILR